VLAAPKGAVASFICSRQSPEIHSLPLAIQGPRWRFTPRLIGACVDPMLWPVHAWHSHQGWLSENTDTGLFYHAWDHYQFSKVQWYGNFDIVVVVVVVVVFVVCCFVFC